MVLAATVCNTAKSLWPAAEALDLKVTGAEADEATIQAAQSCAKVADFAKNILRLAARVAA